jgi:hypothetical protein
MSRLLARLLALVCLIGVSPIARAAAAPSAVTQRDVEAVEIQAGPEAPAQGVAAVAPVATPHASVILVARLFLTHRSLLI